MYNVKMSIGAHFWWIGLAKAEGSWKWTSGEDVSYTNWASGEPDGSANGDGAGIWMRPTFGWLEWDDTISTSENPIICESNSSNKN